MNHYTFTMNQSRIKSTRLVRLGLCAIPYLLFAAFLILCSFRSKELVKDIFSQLGISQSDGEERIRQTILEGAFNTYGLNLASKLATADRKTIAIDILKHTKVYVKSDAFRAEYLTLRNAHKPEGATVLTPQEMREQQVAAYRKAIASAETMVKNADAANKPTFQKLLDDSKAELKKALDPANEMYVTYEKNYAEMLKNIDAGQAKALEDWEKAYPSSADEFIKRRLQEFIDQTGDVDFSAATVLKNGKRVFVDPVNERRSNRWKMAFRAGKDVILPARAFVKEWLSE